MHSIDSSLLLFANILKRSTAVPMRIIFALETDEQMQNILTTSLINMVFHTSDTKDVEIYVRMHNEVRYDNVHMHKALSEGSRISDDSVERQFMEGEHAWLRVW